MANNPSQTPPTPGILSATLPARVAAPLPQTGPAPTRSEAPPLLLQGGGAIPVLAREPSLQPRGSNGQTLTPVATLVPPGQRPLSKLIGAALLLAGAIGVAVVHQIRSRSRERGSFISHALPRSRPPHGTDPHGTPPPGTGR